MSHDEEAYEALRRFRELRKLQRDTDRADQLDRWRPREFPAYGVLPLRVRLKVSLYVTLIFGLALLIYSDVVVPTGDRWVATIAPALAVVLHARMRAVASRPQRLAAERARVRKLIADARAKAAEYGLWWPEADGTILVDGALLDQAAVFDHLVNGRAES